MILHDGRPRTNSWQGSDSSYDINDLICSDSPTRKINVMKLKFFKFEAGVLIETEDEITVTSISEILTGVHTAGFKKSLNQLYGEGSSYEKSGTEKRCFSMIGCISPHDGRHCVDLEIQPVDKQKPEVRPLPLVPLHLLLSSQELQAASMISLGVATAIQVMSNLANTKDVHEIGVIGSLSNVFKSVHDKSPEVRSLSSPYRLTWRRSLCAIVTARQPQVSPRRTAATPPRRTVAATRGLTRARAAGGPPRPATPVPLLAEEVWEGCMPTGIAPRVAQPLGTATVTTRDS
jgi:hypothetical protein